MKTTSRPRAGKRRAAAPVGEPLGPRATWLLGRAAKEMAEHGFHVTSMRDVSRATRTSLAGLYHYFRSKEELLYQIQYRFFGSLLERQEAALEEGGTPEQRLARLLHNHMEFFTEHAAELKVCTYELGSLRGEPYRRVEDLRHRYFKLFAGVVRDRMGARASADDVRHHTLFLFGALNWIFMWFDPKRDAPVAELGEELLDLALRGLPREPHNHAA